MWLQALGPILVGVAAVITALAPFLAHFVRKQGNRPPGDPLSWARQGEWAAGTSLVPAFIVVIAGLAERNPQLNSSLFELLRFVAALIAAIAVSTSAWGIVNGFHDWSAKGADAPKGAQAARIGIAAYLAGAVVVGGMLLIA